jgi:hypothetical protein
MADTLQPDLTVDGARLVTLCADVTLYWRGGITERAEAILAFYQRALELIGSSVRWYETETMGDVAAIDDKVFGMLPLWLSNPKARRGIQALVLQGGEQPTEASSHGFVMFYDQEQPPAMGVVRLVLPAQRLEQSPADFARLVAELAAPFDFESGQAGFSVNWDPRGESSLEAESHLRRIAARYLGIDIPEINTTLVNMQEYGEPAFKCVNWITLLGTDLSQQIGPAEELQAALPAGCRVTDLNGRCMIQAGQAPSLGDKRKKEKLPAYRAVGELLAPFRLQNHAPLFLDDEDATEAWLSRFDG